MHSERTKNRRNCNSRIGMVIEWIHHLTDSGVFCAKEKVEKEHEGKHIIEVNRKVDKAEGQGGKD